MTLAARAAHKLSGNHAFLLCGLDTGLKMIIIMVGRRSDGLAGIHSRRLAPLGLSALCERQHQSFDTISGGHLFNPIVL